MNTAPTEDETVPNGGDDLWPEVEAAEFVDPPDLSLFSLIQKLLLVDLLQNFSLDVEDALTKIAELCGNVDDEEGCEENCATVHQTGGTALIIGVMIRWYDFPSIQAKGCRALAVVSIKNTAFKKSIKASRGLEIIVWAMKSYPDNLAVQTYGCGALANLMRKDFGTAKETAEYIATPWMGPI